MRILFYLPVVTPFWLETLLLPMLAALQDHAELHVLAPAEWQHTGIGARELAMAAHLDRIRWHIVDDGDHGSLRTRPSDPEGLIAFVRDLAPDHVLCRSAEDETPRRFPGRVQYIMETGASPLRTDVWLRLQDGIFEHGVMPELEPGIAQRLDALFAPRWQAAVTRCRSEGAFALDRAAACAAMGLPDDRRIVAVPLEYAHPENFFDIHHRFPDNCALIDHLVAQLPPGWVLAATDHPLNEAYCDTTALRACIDRHQGRVRLVSGEDATGLMVKHCDALVVQNSKTFAAGAFFAKPILRLSHCRSADWLNLFDDAPSLFAAVERGDAPVADPDRFRLWVAYHLLDEAFLPATLTGADLIGRMTQPVDPARWADALDRYDAFQPRSLHHA